MATRVSYPLEIKMKAIEMRLARVPVREVMEQLGIRIRHSQITSFTDSDIWIEIFTPNNIRIFNSVTF
ncbi:hypothetical protein A7311_01380 [Paenibacillus polymyxa]|nr:hypothetical protein A7311_01380 [Paenibacillus polymyxa]